jgi:hypothetical protein
MNGNGKNIVYQLNLVKKLHEKHPTFSEPDPNAIVWRFPKLVSLLDRKALFFVKASKLFDPFEGPLPEFNKINRPSVYAEHKADDESFNKFVQEIERTFSLVKPTTLINSWYINEYESAVMWDLYSRRNTGIAIQSNFKSLCESFKDNKDDVIWAVLVVCGFVCGCTHIRNVLLYRRSYLIFLYFSKIVELI